MTPTTEQCLDPVLQPIGHVETSVADTDIAGQRRHLISDIVVNPEWQDALLGIGDYSHVFVIFWMHRIDPVSFQMQVHPRGRADLPLTGVLATRNRHHPNPLGLAVTELLEVSANRLRVRRLDAFNGTPVIDIKPVDRYDLPEDLRMPAWWPGQRS